MTTIEKDKFTRGYGHNGYIKFAFLVIITSIMALSLALVSCKPDSDLGEYTVPDTYTTYTDKNGLFSVSYPSDWIINPKLLSHFEDESDSLNEYLKGNKQTIDNPLVPNATYKNHWLLLSVAGEDGQLNVGAHSIADSSLKGKTKDQIYNWALDAKDYKPFLQQTLRIAGNEVAIFKVPPQLEITNVVSVTLTDNFVWGVSCSPEGSDTVGDMKDSQIIVRSLRVLK